MALTTIAQSKTERLEIISSDGKIDRALLPEIPKDTLIREVRKTLSRAKIPA